jgi:hypothetical protein
MRAPSPIEAALIAMLREVARKRAEAKHRLTVIEGRKAS